MQIIIFNTPLSFLQRRYMSLFNSDAHIDFNQINEVYSVECSLIRNNIIASALHSIHM